MNTFKKKSLCTALAGVSVLGLAGVAQAVNVNADGLGQVLLYPYYTVRESADGAKFDSLISVVNTTASAKVVKVRFIEGKASREVLDFNLFLSPFDVWTGAVVATDDGAALISEDKSCARPQPTMTPQPFSADGYGAAYNPDPLDSSLDRTREGYVEIIEMGDLRGKASGGTWETAVTHKDGVPNDCDYVRNKTPLVWAGGATDPESDQITAGKGGLFGSMTLVNPKAGLDIAYDPTALENFSAVHLWADPGSIDPNLAQVNPSVSVVVNNTLIQKTTWADSIGNAQGIDAVSAVLMHDNIYNEFVISNDMKTDWVVTMPTKSFYYTGPGTDNIWTPEYLFQRNLTANGACDDVNLTFYDREERTVSSSDSWSPRPIAGKDTLCWEANVITFKGSNVFGSKNKTDITNPKYGEGWVRLSFPTVTATDAAAGVGYVHKLIVDSAAATPVTQALDINTGTTVSTYTHTTFTGLPVVGFAAQVFNNGALDSAAGKVIANYGGRLNHKASRGISNTP